MKRLSHGHCTAGTKESKARIDLLENGSRRAGQDIALTSYGFGALARSDKNDVANKRHFVSRPKRNVRS